MSDTEAHHGVRSLGRGLPGAAGLLITLGIHGALAFIVYQSQMRSEPRPEAVRDVIITKMVRFEKPREKHWLPRIVQPPPPKAPEPVIKVTDNPVAPPAPPAPKEAPKPQDREISKDLQRALQRAQALARAAKEEPEEGSAQGSLEGTANENVIGDEYMTAVHDAIKRNWSAPSGLLNDAQLAGLTTEVKVHIDSDGSLKNPSLFKSSGNDLFDDACVQAVKATGQVPPPPVAWRTRVRRGVSLEFAGRDLSR